MSVRTTMNEAQDKLKESILEGLRACNEILDPGTWGYEDYSALYLSQISEVRHALNEMYLKFYK